MELSPDLRHGGQSCDELPWLAFFSFFPKLECNRNGLKLQCVKCALAYFVVLAGSCLTVVGLPNASQASDLVAFAGIAGDNFAAWEGSKGLSLAASCWLLCSIDNLCSRDALAAWELV